MRSIVRRESQELSHYRYDEDLHPATTPAFLASIPEANDFIAADRARRRPRRIGHLTRAEFPGSTGELRSRYWSAHPSPTCEYPTSPPHRPRQNSSQGQFELKSSFSYFDGDSYAEDYLDWENEVDEFFYYTYIPQERQVKYVIRKLTGRASDWWMYLTQARRCEGRSEVRTWRKMKRLLREQFLSSEILGELYSKEKLASEEEFRMKEEDGDEGSVGNLSRSRSVPTSAPTYGSIGLNAEDSDSRTHDKSVVMEGTAKCRSGKTSFKGRESSLLYLKSKKSCRDESVSSLREIAENGPQILSAEVVDDMHDDSSPAIQTPIPVASLSRSFVTEMGRISFPVDLNNNSDEIKISPKANLPHQEPELDILRDQLKSFLNQRLLGMRSEESSSLQNQVQAVAPIVLQQYAPDVIEVLLSEASLAISLLTNRRTRDMIMILTSKRFLDRLVSTLVEKKQHELKLRESLKDLGVRRRELQKSLASSWPKQVYERINAPLLTLVSFGGPEQSYAVLSHLLLLVMRAPFLFSLDYKHFYCQYSEPSYVQKLKLEMLTAIANESNTYEIFTELCENVTNVDISISRESIRAVGKIALRQYDVNAIVDRLLQFLEMEKDYVSAETLVLVKDLLRKSPQWSHDCIAVVGNISLLNGFVGNALGSCLDYSPPSVPLHGNFDVGDLTFNLEESFTGVQPSYESYAVELRSWAQSEHKIFNEEIVVKAFFEDQLQHLQNFPPKPGWCASFSTPDF